MLRRGRTSTVYQNQKPKFHRVSRDVGHLFYNQMFRVRSGNSSSRLRISDKTLLYLASLEQQMDCVVLSTDCAHFSLKAMREFLTVGLKCPYLHIRPTV